MSDGFDTSAYLPLFLGESREHLETLNNALVKIEADPTDRKMIEEVFRVAHSFKGMSATMGFESVADLTHHMEEVLELLRVRRELPREALDLLFKCLDLLERMVNEIDAGGSTEIDVSGAIGDLRVLAEENAQLKYERDDLQKKNGADGVSLGGDGLADDDSRAPAEFSAAEVSSEDVGDRRAGPAPALAERRQHSSVRVDSERLDALLHMVGELVVHRSRVEQYAADLGHSDLQQSVADLTRVSQSIQDMVMRVRMVQVDVVFARLPRLVRDLCRQLGKMVDLQVTGSETELDRTAVEALGDPLVHLIRNAVDHGIERPDERRATDKPVLGTVRVSARHAGGNVVISVQDDGSGVNPDAVAAAAVKKGLISASEAGTVDMQRAVELLFTAGFSTADETTEISGRGVGMDAVRAVVRGFGGDVSIKSVVGQGTTTEIRMPLTLAILPALLVKSAGDFYAIQLDRIERTYEYSDVVVKNVVGKATAVFAEEALPVIDLAQALGNVSSDTPAFMVIVRSADRRLALAVDDMIGQRELVTRALPDQVRRDAPVTGGAILADGNIALIVDCDLLTGEQLVDELKLR